MRDIALDQLQDIDDFKNLCKSLRNRKFDQDKWNTFIDFTIDLDKLRNDNILDHCLEFEKYFD
jgi:hypothetical protein